jgi:hypothetical protein
MKIMNIDKINQFSVQNLKNEFLVLFSRDKLHRIPYIRAHRIPVWAKTECGLNLTVFESLPRL